MRLGRAGRAQTGPIQHGKLDYCFCPDASTAEFDPAWNTGIMPRAEYDSLFNEVQRAYRLAGAPTHVETYFHERGHYMDNHAAFDFLARPSR